MKKKLFSLSPRLKAVSEMISEGSTIIDVGSDHAKLPVWMLVNGKIKKAYASDISKFSVQKIEAIADKYQLSEQLTACHCDGLSGFCGNEFDTVIICGMGGETIAGILSAAKWIEDGRHDIIIQCMSSIDCLNRFLEKTSLKPVDERIIRDSGRLYTIVRLHSFKEHRNSTISLPSEHILSSSLCEEYLNRHIRIAENELSGMLSSCRSDEAQIRAAADYLNHCKELKKALHREVI